MNTSIKIIILITIFVMCGLLVWFFQSKTKENLTHEELPTTEQTEETLTTQISIPLASLEEEGDFGPFGCQQYINFHTIEVPQTQGVLSAVYEQLFTLPYDGISGVSDKNIIASQQNLMFNSVILENGTASLYLSGTVMGNHCADEVFRHQIEQAAFQFDTIHTLQVFLNDEIFDWCVLSDADPSESGCDTNPRPWINSINEIDSSDSEGV